ncbi:unnamed protein product [Calypogeia fissa]
MEEPGTPPQYPTQDKTKYHTRTATIPKQHFNIFVLPSFGSLPVFQKRPLAPTVPHRSSRAMSCINTRRERSSQPNVIGRVCDQSGAGRTGLRGRQGLRRRDEAVETKDWTRRHARKTRWDTTTTNWWSRRRRRLRGLKSGSKVLDYRGGTRC